MRLSDFRAKASSASQHLLKEDPAVDLAHKHQIANCRHIDSGSQQVDCYGNVGVLVVLELLDHLQNLLFVAAGSFARDFHNGIIGNAIGLVNLSERIHNTVSVCIIYCENQRLFSTFRIQVGRNFFQHLAGMIRQNNFAVELRHIEIHFIVQNCTVQKFIGVGVILRQGFTLLELCVIFNEIRINQIWRVVIHQPAIDNRLTVAVGIDRLPENLGRVQGGRSSQGNFHRIEIFDNLLVLAHIIILIIVEDFFFRHFTVKNIASVGFVHNNQIKCTGHQIRFFCQNRAFQKPLHR